MNTSMSVDTLSPPPPNAPEITTFIAHLSLLLSGSHAYGPSLDRILSPWLRWETHFRQLCLQVSSIGGTLILSHRFYGLIDIFDAPEILRRAPPVRVHNPGRWPVIMKLDAELPERLLPNPTATTRRNPGDLTTVPDLEDFKVNWEVFSQGCFEGLTSEDWDNVVVAGGAVEACLAAPTATWVRRSKETRKEWFEKMHENSDIDVFFYGLNREQTEAKIAKLVSAIQSVTAQDPELKRTKHTYSLLCGYSTNVFVYYPLSAILTRLVEEPYRKVQFVLRKFASPADVLVDFDVDAPCCLYDGSRVYSSPRSIVAFMRQANVVDYKRHSPIYELRLAKYHLRGYECYFPGFERESPNALFIGTDPDAVYFLTGPALLLTLESQFQLCPWLGSKRNILKEYCKAASGEGADDYAHFVDGQPGYEEWNVAEQDAEVDEI